MRSMTGYGSHEGPVGKGVLFVEIRGVNSRFLDVNCKFPVSIYPLEPQIRKLIQSHIVRGKIEIFIKERANLADTFEIVVNKELVRQYKKCLAHINDMLGLKTSSHLLEVVDLKELVVSRERPINIGMYWGQIQKVIIKALAKFDAMKKKEGETLKKDQMVRLKYFAHIIHKLETLSNKRIATAKAKKMLNNGSNDLADKPAMDRRNAEISALSDKMDVTEEITRLKSHIGQYRSLLAKNGAVGRQIDFLLQEMHREINTLGSKSFDAQISSVVVEAKAELEKLREQVQNFE